MVADDEGVVFPVVDGRRSTSATGRAVIADAVRDFDPGLAATVERERDWRAGYLPAFRRLTELSIPSPEAAYGLASAGLASVHERFRFVRGDADGTVLEALQVTGAAADQQQADEARTALGTVVVTGASGIGSPTLVVPYRGERLAGAGLDRLLDDWVDRGVVEPSFAEAVAVVAAHPEWLDLRDLTVVLLGAGAEMGPLVSLLGWGAHVVAVDLPGHDIWRGLIAQARGSPGRLSVPVRRSGGDAAGSGIVSRTDVGQPGDDERLAGAAGLDLVTELPELRDWLTRLAGHYILGSYVYADGPLHVRTSVAVDALMVALCAERPELSLAFLATPTDAFAVPEDVVEDSRHRGGRTPRWQRIARAGSAGRLFGPNYRRLFAMDDGRLVGVNDSLVPQQGPNYALAKRIQRWRAALARRDGHLVSVNVAPATRTRSVVRNRLLAAAYAGAHRFGVEVFDPSTSNTLMAALLVHDVRNQQALANPKVPLHHPAELLWQGANHGGLWRNPYAPRSVLGAAVVLGMVQRGA